VAAAGTYAAQGPQAPPANARPNLQFHNLLSLSGSKIVWDVRNAGPETLYSNDPVGYVEVWSGPTTVFTSPTLVAPYDIYPAGIQRFEFDLSTAGLPNGPVTARVEMTSLASDLIDLWHDSGVFSVV
jgi:hypothetical protein